MRGVILTAAFLVVLQSGAVFSANSSISAELAKQGHAHTKLCNLRRSSLGLGHLPFIQFAANESQEEDLQEAVAILQLLADGLVDAGARYVGFEAREKWDSCQTQEPEFLFWRDSDDNWRYMRKRPVRYLAAFQKNLSGAQRGTATEAYVLWSLGVVQQRLGRQRAGLKNMEAAYQILEDTDDPNEILPYVLLPLVQYHLGEDGNPQLGQAYLERFALISESSVAEGEHVPLIKVAPRYPVNALLRRIEGYVLMEFIVDAEGRVRNPVVIEESPEGIFGNAALEAAGNFRYVPKVVNGEFVATHGVRNKITFEIAD